MSSSIGLLTLMARPGLMASLLSLTLAQPAPAQTWTVAPPPTSPPLFVIGDGAAPTQPVVITPAPAPTQPVIVAPPAAPAVIVTSAPAPLPFPAAPAPAPVPPPVVTSEASAAVVIVPTVAAPAPAPVPPPPPVLVSPPPPTRRAHSVRAPRAQRGTGMLVAGASILGTTWLFSSLAGAIIIDGAADRRSESLGRSLLVPVVGPWLALANSQSATGSWFLSLVGIAQTTGALLTAGGIVRQNRYRRLQASRGLTMGATPLVGGGQVSFGMRF